MKALFDEQEAARFNDGWVQAHAVLQVLRARGLAVAEPVRARIVAAPDAATLQRWLVLAATAPSVEAFVAGMT